MSRFWYYEPIIELNQQPMSLPLGLFPACEYLGTLLRQEFEETFYSRKRLDEMVVWLRHNCKSRATWSEKYGSFAFMEERDRAMFRLFYDDEHMPEPTHWPGMENPPKLRKS